MAAGLRALGRGDERAAAGLLERALTLTRPLRSDVHAELDLAQALWHEPERAARIAEEAAARAGEAGDETGEALARAMAAFFRLTLAAELRRTSSRRSSSTHAAGSRRRRITWG